MRDNLTAALTARLRRAQRDGDPAALLESQALEEANHLLGFLATPAGPDPLDPQVQYLVGCVLLGRSTAPPSQDQRSDELVGLRLLLPLYWNQPDMLPETVRAALASALPNSGRPPEGTSTTVAYAASRVELATLLVDRLVRFGDVAAGRSAILVLRAAVHDLPAGHRLRPTALHGLGFVLMASAEREAGPRAGLAVPITDEAISSLREAMDTTAPDDPLHAHAAHGIALALRGRALSTDDLGPLAETIDLLRTAVGAAPDLDGALASMLADLGTTLILWLTSTEDAAGPATDERWAAADEAVTALRRSIGLTPREAPETPRRLLGLAAALQARHLLRADPDGVQEAIAVLILAASAVPDGSTDREAIMDMVGDAMLLLPYDALAGVDPEVRAGFEYIDGLMSSALGAALSGDDGPAGGLAPFLRVIGLAGAPEHGPGSQGSHVGTMRAVAELLNHRGEAGLIEAVGILSGWLADRVLRLPPQARADAIERYLAGDEESSGDEALFGPVDLTDVEELLVVIEGIRAQIPADHPERPFVALGHGLLRLVRLGATEVPREDRLAGSVELAAILRDLTESVMPAVQEQMGLSTADLEAVLALSTAAGLPFDDVARLERLVREGRQRLAHTAEDSPEQHDVLRSLASALFQHYFLFQDEASYQEALGHARRLVPLLVSADPALRVLLMLWTSAVAFHAGPVNLGMQAGETDTPESSTARLASTSAVSALVRGDVPTALETLEEGRARLLSGAIDTRRELGSLRRADPRLATRFIQVRERVRAGRTQLQDFAMAPPEGIERFRGLVQEWRALIAELNELPGYERFMLPLPLGLPDLLPAAAEGPVVTINVHGRRCDALVLSVDGVRGVALPRLRAADIVQQAEVFHEAIAIVAEGGDGPLARQASDVITDTLGWLWDVLAEPVLAALGLTGPPEEGALWPRLWWSPTGALTRLPLHAAGQHGQAGRSVLDRVVSSYTPTLRALMYSRAHRISSPRTVLVVAMPETPGHPPLRQSVQEARAFDGAAGLTRLVGSKATRAAVGAALPGAAIAHFACHAGSNPADPYASHLLLQDGALDLGAIARFELDGAELAYLSACGTARGGARLADEAVHAASAFQLAGYAQSVATLWEIGDEVAAMAATAFYRELSGRGSGEPGDRLPAARALHEVTRRLRESMPDRPWAWASLVHAGA
ncbi:CHAT domain protein [Frankia canadensis]|uniref:CHAT domain protein n=1 Tax=Frankia canadensis TaxID=1836972 RepID=A0A2I2KYT8_9ACTN|nr:CHAT domain-containing protein [Frankia canadensis]SNQ50819.1 CHAT domain protein [Frankia canadensis]SOU58109.1 CHAT domain protein [Frankia canadensis]